jgi:hypothetical protein
LSKIRGAVLKDRVEGISNSPLSGSASASTLTSASTSTLTEASSSLKTRTRKVAGAVHQLSALQELLEQWDTKSKQEHHSAEDRYQVLELRDKILRIRKCITFSMLIVKKISHFFKEYGAVYTGCPRRNVPDFGRVFLMLKYTDITQNTYVQS